ncbi:hypothetical protein FOPG_19952 [Fusarium oxysporum f. sp. conglutinans race 2 54008]|uniref:Uncharacterized protein n=1 Tax=Fusarium oxysporum f. sp. conglutinans race 2 54008 TaxID=1089457 RepID=X0GV49_FUSOX|nr:hypothetical protein FOPG_19952 [Fusarium oxysporum f. sp. conglutinans race 2 54008]
MPTYVLAGEYLELNLVDLFQLTEIEGVSTGSPSAYLRPLRLSMDFVTFLSH